MKITLYLMSEKGFETLKCLTENNFAATIESVIGSRDGNVQQDFYDEIKALCSSHGIKHFDRKDGYRPASEYSLAVSWRWLIPESNGSLIVLHDSLLPKYRGFAPLVNMLLNREKTIGVTALFATEDYDSGDVIYQSATEICHPITIEDAIKTITGNYRECALFIFEKIKNGEALPRKKQDETQATYSLWRDEEDYRISWEDSAEEILNHIYALGHPYKGASAFIGDAKIRIFAAELSEDLKIESRDVGKVIFIKEQCPVVVCGSGLLKLTDICSDNTGESILPLKNFRTRFK